MAELLPGMHEGLGSTPGTLGKTMAGFRCNCPERKPMSEQKIVPRRVP